MAVSLRRNRSLSGPPVSYDPELERLELELLLEGVFRHYGFDFRSYAYASIRRRLWKRIEAEELRTISELQALVLHDTDAMERLLRDRTHALAMGARAREVGGSRFSIERFARDWDRAIMRAIEAGNQGSESMESEVHGKDQESSGDAERARQPLGTAGE